MKKPSISPAARKAIMIGSLCTISYLAVYVAKNLLGAVSPQMLEKGVFNNQMIGTLSSAYFFAYAFGQLINGQIGDKIKSKYMIGFGLILGGVCAILFRTMAVQDKTLAVVVYAGLGFFLAMVYAPMTKTVVENTEPIYATRCSIGYTFASLVGSPAAGLLAAFLVWQSAFSVGSGFLLTMGALVLIVFTLFERRGIIKYGHFQKPKGTGSIKVLIEHRIIRFTLVSAITGVIRTSVTFWLPTYYAQHLGFSASDSAKLFTVTTLVISCSAPLAIALYERLFKRVIDRALLFFFSMAAAGFLCVFLSGRAKINILFIVFAVLSSQMASNMLWSCYCPSLRDTGMTSGATGFLDFASYMVAATASKLFANAIDAIGWSPLILIWMGLMVCGVALFLPIGRRKRLTSGQNVVE